MKLIDIFENSSNMIVGKFYLKYHADEYGWKLHDANTDKIVQSFYHEPRNEDDKEQTKKEAIKYARKLK